MVRYIDATPRWAEILPTWLMLYQQAAEGNCINPALVKENARAELRRMAEAADRWNDAAPFMAAIQQFTMGELTNSQFINAVLDAERAVERNTVKESI